MVKPSNRAKGKPSKRKTLKTKYKIERKVKQHRKKMRKQAKKLGKKGIKPRKNEEKYALPNSFPFKNQILQHFKDQKPIEEHCPTKDLVSSDWGLIALQPKLSYFPKDKDHFTKKYITNESQIWKYANVIIEVLDSRNCGVCIDNAFRTQCQNRGVNRIAVVSKSDTVGFKHLQNEIQELKKSGEVVVEFSTEHKKKNASLENLLKAIQAIGQGTKKCVVVGKSNTGKHTIIKLLMKLSKFHNEDYATLSDVQIQEGIHMIDTPYTIKDDTNFPLFHPPSNIGEDSVMMQEERVLNNLFFSTMKNRNETLMHYGIQDYISLDDFLKKVGKANRTFGKGGMIDVGTVRSNILKAYYSGKINHLFV